MKAKKNGIIHLSYIKSYAASFGNGLMDIHKLYSLAAGLVFQFAPNERRRTRNGGTYQAFLQLENIWFVQFEAAYPWPNGTAPRIQISKHPDEDDEVVVEAKWNSFQGKWCKTSTSKSNILATRQIKELALEIASETRLVLH